MIFFNRRDSPKKLCFVLIVSRYNGNFYEDMVDPEVYVMPSAVLPWSRICIEFYSVAQERQKNHYTPMKLSGVVK